MKILHTADWHIGDFPGPTAGGINLRAEDTENCILDMYLKAHEFHPDFMLISGDIFQTAQVWAARGLDETRQACEQIDRFAVLCPVVVLRGTPNHDGDKQFEMLAAYFAENDRVEIVTAPRVLYLQSQTGEMLQVAAIPGFDRGEFRAKHSGLSSEDENRVFTDALGQIVLGLSAQCDPVLPSVLMAHYTVPGCNTEAGQVQFFSGQEPMIEPETLMAGGFDLVALGHIHRPQKVDGLKNVFYSGGINATNFNDEGQDRGFYVHELDGHEVIDSTFYPTPTRQFLTLRLDIDDIARWNAGSADLVAEACWGDQARDKIVRVLYSCAPEDGKAFVPAIMAKRLEEDGAFWVSDILPEFTEEAINKESLSKQAEPEENLIQYLTEKGMENARAAAIVEMARPIIVAAVSAGTGNRFTGIFEPVEIEVKNYRRYAAERFSFKEITFCTINGKNGAGKSSLFMDAIIDCLYEEPREGEITGWISNLQDVRSGSISFTFRIGEKTFRVARTRSKAGKATLNLSELVDGEWENRSMERLRDTQSEIINVLGMDSMTFRSCAMIMQDQYGLFLEANKEDRMTILGNILGLGVYADMEELARIKGTNVGREITQRTAEIKGLLESVEPQEALETQYTDLSSLIHQETGALAEQSSRRDTLKGRVEKARQAAEQADRLDKSLTALTVECRKVRADEQKERDAIVELDAFLTQAPKIQAGAARYRELELQEKSLIAGKALYDAKSGELASTEKELQQTQLTRNSTGSELSALTSRMDVLCGRLKQEDELREYAMRHKEEAQSLDSLRKRSQLYISLSGEIAIQNQRFAKMKNQFDTGVAVRNAEIDSLRKKTGLLADCGCIDPDRASCKFLADAKEAEDKLPTYIAGRDAWMKSCQEKLDEVLAGIQTLERQREELHYDSQTVAETEKTVAELEPLAAQYNALETVRQEIALLRERVRSQAKTIEETQERLEALKSRGESLTKEVENCISAANDHAAVVAEMGVKKHWLEEERQLPVVAEKKAAALARLEVLQEKIGSIEDEFTAAQQELAEQQKAAAVGCELGATLEALDRQLSDAQSQLSGYQIKLGGLRQRLTDIEQARQRIDGLQQEINGLSETATYYDALKTAFSQDGIPHNIIRSILPQLTASANSILGQMTGGTMGMEFRTEKTLKSNKREVVTLDIFIEEHGRGSLPYLSKSGGEKVKSALSASLALAEIKSRSVGVQLGMLFIDEPPFLDDDGTQAYCDALETIWQRYGAIKVMAITHDPTMKARFPQSLDVVKTEEGSRVVLN